MLMTIFKKKSHVYVINDGGGQCPQTVHVLKCNIIRKFLLNVNFYKYLFNSQILVPFVQGFIKFLCLYKNRIVKCPQIFYPSVKLTYSVCRMFQLKIQL